MPELIAPRQKTLKEIFTEDFQHEYFLVEAIKDYLLTSEQLWLLHKNKITIEDCLNGRLGDVSDEVIDGIKKMYQEWNEKIGEKIFFDDML